MTAVFVYMLVQLVLDGVYRLLRDHPPTDGVPTDARRPKGTARRA
jgi:hypothetical protein